MHRAVSAALLFAKIKLCNHLHSAAKAADNFLLENHRCSGNFKLHRHTSRGDDWREVVRSLKRGLVKDDTWAFHPCIQHIRPPLFLS